jgi:hypothetical protein
MPVKRSLRGRPARLRNFTDGSPSDQGPPNQKVITHKGGFPVESSLPIYGKPTIRYAVGTRLWDRALSEPVRRFFER